MPTFRVWEKDEFDQQDADEREDAAIEIAYDSSTWSTEKRGKKLHYRYPIDTAERAAEVFADWYHAAREGWESTWPVAFVVHDGDRYVAIEVDRDMVPEFRSGKPKQVEVSP